MSLKVHFVLWDILSTLGYLIMIIGLLQMYYLPPLLCALLLITFVISRTIARMIRGLSEFLYPILYPIIQLLYIMIQFILYGIPAVIILLKGGFDKFGFIISRAFVGGFEIITLQIIELVQKGHISVVIAIFSITMLIFFRILGLEIHSVWVYKLIYNWIAPLFSLAIFLTELSKNDLKTSVLIFSSVLALFLALISIYIMSLGFLTSTKKKR